jgi:hypothetical protein
VVLALEKARRLDTNFKKRTLDIVESEKADEGSEQGPVLRKGPVMNQIELGLSRAIAVGSNVVADILDAIGKELAFLELESDAVFLEDVADAFKQKEERGDHSRPQEDVVNDDAIAKMGRVGRMARFEKRCPFAFENVHHAGVKGRSVARAERHDTKAVLLIIGGKESELLLIARADGNLVVASLVVEGYRIETTSQVAEVVDSIVTTRDRIFERKGDLVQATVRNAHAPNKIEDVEDMLLMRLGGEDDRGAPRPITFADPSVAKEDFNVLHDNLTLVRPIMGLLATNGGGTTSADGEFEVEDRKLNAGRIEAVPMGFDDGNDGRADGRVNSRTDNKVLGEFGKVLSAVPKVKIGAIVGERGRGMTNRTAVLLKKKDAIVDIVAVVHGNVAIDRLRAPDLRGDVDDERMSNRARIKMIIKIGDAGGRQGGEWERRRNNDRVDASRG